MMDMLNIKEIQEATINTLIRDNVGLEEELDEIQHKICQNLIVGKTFIEYTPQNKDYLYKIIDIFKMKGFFAYTLNECNIIISWVDSL